MSDVRSGPVLRQLNVLFRSGTGAGMNDGQLLERFAARRDALGEVAFAALVARHGPMVLGTCRQLLGESNDADDAFQGTFLTLARKAGSIRQPDRLGAWLHGVAVRKARKLKLQRERRRRHERRRPTGPGESSRVESQAEHRENSVALHEELARLPEKYRVPIVLCYLEGHTHETAAMALGWPLGTVRGRLARAREQLRERLARRGVVPAVMAVGGWPHHPLARAVVPTGLAEATINVATPAAGRWTSSLASLSAPEAIWANAMRSTAVRVAAVLVIAGGIATGGAALGRRTVVAERRPDAVVGRPAAIPDREAGDHRLADGLVPAPIPAWVGDALRTIEPEARIERARRESDTAYVVDVRIRGQGRLFRVTGRFEEGRKAVTVLSVRDGVPAGR